MTFSNSHLQNVLLRLHRGLLSGLPIYKEKCVLSEVDYVNKKALDDTYVKKDTFIMKSLETGEFLYILGPCENSEGDRIYYGRVKINVKVISHLCEQLYWILSKMAVSEKKSEAVKNRDFILYRKDLLSFLIDLGKKFYPSFYTLPEGMDIELTRENIEALISMLEKRGTVCTNAKITSYLRHLHECKYRIKE